MDEMQAAVVRRKLPFLPAWTAARQAVAARYTAGLRRRSRDSRPPSRFPGGTNVFHLYVLRAQRRDELLAHLKARNIGAGVYYPVPLHRQPCFRRFDPAACPVSDRLATETIAIPCFPGLRADEQDTVIGAIRGFYGRA